MSGAVGTARPTERELDVLEVLWRRGPSTVREVLDDLGEAHEAGYTSLQKIMTIMLDKQLVARQPEGRQHRYRALVAQDAVQRRFAGEMLERLFGGSVAAFVQSALASRPASASELDEVKALLEQTGDRDLADAAASKRPVSGEDEHAASSEADQ